MKISKLFHWLYGLIMLLPIFAIGTTCLISTFNMSAKEESEIIYKYVTNEVNSLSDLQVGNIYKLNTTTISRNETREIFYCTYLEVFDFSNTTTSYSASTYGDTYKIGLLIDTSYNNISIRLYNGNTFVIALLSTGYQRFNYINFTLLELLDNSILSSISSVPNDEIPIESVETHNVETQDVFYNAVNKVTTHPLFSWSYNSFLTTPFVYICNLFSLPSNSVIVELLSYWLAISIIWLVFDLIMYIPLLVHRWLDKGVIE